MKTYNLTRKSDSDILALLVGEGYDNLASFTTNEDGSFTVTTSDDVGLEPEDLSDIQDTMLGIDIYEQAEV